ncbi:MAG: LicD family protein [Clostridia bacterium]|nr:LicD family protein [Clostridia bacterium]
MIKEKAITPATLQEHQSALKKLLEEFDRVCKKLNIPYILFAGTMLGAVRHQGFIPWDDDLDVLMLRKDYEFFLQHADEVLEKETFSLQKEFTEHWPMFFSKLRLNETTCLEKYHPKDFETHHGVYIDIFPCDNAAKTSFARKIQFFASKVVIAKSLKKRGYETRSSLKKVFMKVCSFLPTSLFRKLATHGKENSKLVHSFFAAAKDFSKNVYPREFVTERVNLSFEGGSYPVSKEYDQLLNLLYGDYMVLPPQEEREDKKHVVLVDLTKPYEYYREYHENLDFDVLTKSIR